MEILIEKVIFKSPVVSNKLIYVFKTEMSDNLTQLFSHHYLDDGSEKTNIYSIHKNNNKGEVINGIINDNGDFYLTIDERDILDAYEFETTGIKKQAKLGKIGDK